ncbi:hypothetical protein CIW48_15525 [Methylobacterium sp. P1-11]|uniref:hypothetical protein n=1 Tax=Methylobacterium sp. P1-11 TaxID=2024616 RepID=UPI0011EC9DFB|nr:hypothetical protein [Methylobacterium sp. P1-11]KAA0122851.1 hypothetical protein CIW48_15525 [Methylobacterium sp. P1-11]
MLTWPRRLPADTEALERRLAGELHATEERLSRRISVIERRLDENEQVLRRLGHQIARMEGRLSIHKASSSASNTGDEDGVKEPVRL